MRGQRRIAGGRRRVCQALYMAALGAIRCVPRFKAHYIAIKQRSGHAKVEIKRNHRTDCVLSEHCRSQQIAFVRSRRTKPLDRKTLHKLALTVSDLVYRVCNGR